MPLLPVAVYGLDVTAGDGPIPAAIDFPATIRISMAAIDPNAEPQMDQTPKGVPPRATLKIIREQQDFDESEDDEDEDDDDIDAIRARLQGVVSDEESDDESDDDDEKNGGPSDPAKTKKARTEAALKKIMENLGNEDDDMDVDEESGSKKSKGKAPAVGDEDSEEESDDEGVEVEEFVICTLDPQRQYQQPLDITIGERERVYFQVTGAYNVSLTGNYVVPDEGHSHDHDEDSDEDEDYDLSPDEDELEGEYSDEDDELDGLQDPRITEVESEEEAPKLVEAKKGKNKRAAEDSETLDSIMEKAEQAEQKLSKKQQKKLKNNAGEAVAAAAGAEKKDAKDSPANGKKVQFAKNLEQGPTGSPLPAKGDKKEDKKDQKSGLGVKMVNGVKIDDKKLGSGPAAKKGDRIGMRYIGKLEKDGKVFDSNKKGKPFSFKLGVGEVIKGWDVGVAGMTVGSERRITIPSSLAYGKQSLPGIPANSNLVFDVKLVSLN